MFPHLNLKVLINIRFQNSCVHDFHHFEHWFFRKLKEIYFLVDLENVKLNIIDKSINLSFTFTWPLPNSILGITSVNIERKTFTDHCRLIIFHFKSVTWWLFLKVYTNHREPIPVVEKLLIFFSVSKIIWLTLSCREFRKLNSVSSFIFIPVIWYLRIVNVNILISMVFAVIICVV